MSDRTNLIRHIAAQTRIPIATVRQVVDSMSRIALDDIASEGKFVLPDVVSMKVITHKPFRYKDVHDGQMKYAPAGYKIRCKPSRAVRTMMKRAERQ